MGVEFYTCENCRETFSDYGKYVSCGDRFFVARTGAAPV